MAQIAGNTFYCKSSPAFWLKEKTGTKRNTVRSLIELAQDGILVGDIERCEIIQILNTQSKKLFTRIIKDVSYWDNWVIISW